MRRGPQNLPLPINSLLCAKLPKPSQQSWAPGGSLGRQAATHPRAGFATVAQGRGRLALPSGAKAPSHFPTIESGPFPCLGGLPWLPPMLRLCALTTTTFPLSSMKSRWAVGETRGDGEDREGCVKIKTQYV